MNDTFEPLVSEARHKNMAAIRGKNTKPELLIRRQLHAHGYRYRVHVKSLPGTPDIVMPKFQAVVLVNGCFWHGHDCDLFRWPKTREEFWFAKIRATQRRDVESVQKLNESGWRIAIIWQCALRTELGLKRTVNDLEQWLNSAESDDFQARQQPAKPANQ